MTKTLDDTETKSNPYITKSISKTLLTPCRRVGLPRKKQTPNSSSTPNFENVEKVSTSSNSETTPSNSNLSSHAQHQVTENGGSSQLSAVKDKKKNKVSKRLIIDDKEALTAQSNTNVVGSDSQENSVHSSKVYDEKDVKKAQSNNASSKDYVVVMNKRKSKVLESDNDNEDKHVDCTKNNKTTGTKKFEKIHKDSDSDEDFKIIKHSPKTKLKCKKKEINLYVNQKTNSNNTKQKSEESNKLKSSSLEDVTNCDSNKKNGEHQLKKSWSSMDATSPISQKTKKIKRSLSMKKSSDEVLKKPIKSDHLVLKECSISSSPIKTRLEGNIPAKVSLSELQNLEKVVDQKQKLVSDLKQAEIYQKKHNVQELKKLTNLWRSGCIAALNDLLPHLQTHANIDMANLLKNLRVPENLISLSQSGELI